jgi:hypothetical protein
LHNDIAAAAAIAARRTAPGDILFPPESDATVAAIAGFDQNLCFIDKHTYKNQLPIFPVYRKGAYTRS